MLDLKLIRNDPEFVREALRRRGAHAEAALDNLLELDKTRRELLVAVEEKRALRNTVSEDIARAKRAKEDASGKIEAMRQVATRSRPSMSGSKRSKPGSKKSCSRYPTCRSPAPQRAVRRTRWPCTSGESRASSHSPPRTTWTWRAPCDMIDMERGARTSGSRFAYLKGDLVFLQFALVQFALQKLASKGFRPVVVPVLVRDEAMYGTGFFPTDMQQVYRVEADGLNLVGTSEVPLAALHMDEILDEADLPVRYVGYSSCFRREAGAAGKDTRGIFRVHQFDKVEMFSFCAPDKSAEEHDFMRGIEEELLQELGLPYRAVNIAAGDLGASAAKKYDCEVWLPTQERFREVTSCSNCTDYQARRLRVRAKGEKGSPYLVHTLNGTVVAIGRTIIAIMENYQTEEGLVEVPAALRPFLPAGKETLGA